MKQLCNSNKENCLFFVTVIKRIYTLQNISKTNGLYFRDIQGQNSICNQKNPIAKVTSHTSRKLIQTPCIWMHEPNMGVTRDALAALICENIYKYNFTSIFQRRWICLLSLHSNSPFRFEADSL